MYLLDTHVLVWAAARPERLSRAAIRAEAMHWPHRDPYDRILAAQAIVEGATLITADEIISANAAVPTLW